LRSEFITCSPHITNLALLISDGTLKTSLIRGDTIGSVLAASIYVAVRQSGVPRTLDDISEITDIKPEVARSYRRIISELDIKVQLIDPRKYMLKIPNNLDFDEKIRCKVLELMEKAQKKSCCWQGSNKHRCFYTLYCKSFRKKTQNTRRNCKGCRHNRSNGEK
jgi:transcription initiation factor TFIIB